MNYANITKPTLLIDEQKVRANLRMMLKKAQNSNAMLRPHFKTPQSLDVVRWYREEGITKATVSSVDMARYFAEGGWDDITIAFPYNPREWQAVQDLAQKIQLNVLITSIEALVHLKSHVKAKVGYFIKLDVGTHRTGVYPWDQSTISQLAQMSSDTIQFRGFLAHAGHSYKKLNPKAAEKIYWKTLKDFEMAKSFAGVSDTILSYGDTPSCSLLDDFSAVDELRPGNFAFYDVMQYYFGSCNLDQIAVCMACPVVSVHPERKELVLFGGAVHLSKDMVERGGEKTYGLVVELTESGWKTKPIGEIVRLSQEHGVVHANSALLSRVRVGDLVGVLPIHSCLTADLQGYYVSLGGQRLEKLNKAVL